jgi:hypothetical protein
MLVLNPACITAAASTEASRHASSHFLLLLLPLLLTLHLQHQAQHSVSSWVLGAKVDGEVVHLQEQQQSRTLSATA